MFFDPLRVQRTLKIHALTPKSLAKKAERPILIKTPVMRNPITLD